MQVTALPPDGLRVLAPAKLNLFLEVGGKRADGFHEIDALFQCVSLYDELEFRPARDSAIRLEEDDLDAGESNLVYRAAKLLQGTFPAAKNSGVRIRLRKHIPVGGGLGGGSSDAAATLIALSKLWNLSARRADLESLGAELGSDVPFFFRGGTARCRGRGERVTPYAGAFDELAPCHYVLVNPGIHVSTKEVYVALAAQRPHTGIALTLSSELDSMTASSIQERLVSGSLFYNGLEGVAAELFPKLRDVASLMKEESFVKVSMTGSGSTFFGLCRSAADATDAARSLEARLSAGGVGREGLSGARVFRVRSQPGYCFSWLA